MAWLEDFLAVIRTGGFSRAAEQRASSQPAFSRRIRSLEDWVGSPLFARAARTVSLTPAGERFKPFAEEVLRQLEMGRQDAMCAAQAATDTLHVAATHVLSLTFFPAWLRQLEGSQPLMAAVQLTADSMAGCERLMVDGDAQFLLCHQHAAAPSRLQPDRFRAVDLGEDCLIPVVAPSLLHQDRLLAGPCLAYAASSGMGRILAAAWRDTGRQWPTEPVFTSHLATVLATMARDARGLAWVPASLVVQDLQAGRLIQVGTPDDVVPMRIILVRPRTRQTAVAERLWARVLACSAQPGALRVMPGLEGQDVRTL